MIRERAQISARSLLACSRRDCGNGLGGCQVPGGGVLAEGGAAYNDHRPHRALRQAAPLRPTLEPIIGGARIIHIDIRSRDRLGGTLREYDHVA